MRVRARCFLCVSGFDPLKGHEGEGQVGFVLVWVRSPGKEHTGWGLFFWSGFDPLKGHAGWGAGGVCFFGLGSIP